MLAQNPTLSDLDFNRRVLLIDDTPTIHQDVQKILSWVPSENTNALEASLFGGEDPEPAPKPALMAQFELTSAYQGEEGLEKVRRACAADTPFALAIVDMRMPPGWDGLQTIQALWEVDPNLQVVICTAYSDHSWKDIISTLGHSDRLLVLKKPFDRIELLQLLHALTHKWSLGAALTNHLENLESVVQERTAHLRATNHQLREEMCATQLLQEELRLSHKMEALGQLVAGIVTEFNAPVGHVRDSLATLDRRAKDLADFVHAYRRVVDGATVAAVESFASTSTFESLQDDLRSAHKSSLDGLEHIAGIVQAMAAYASPHRHEISQVELNGIIDDTVSICRSSYAAAASISTALNPLQPVQGSATQLGQVVLIFLRNARDAVAERWSLNPRQGRIRIASFCDGGSVRVEVDDNGCGVPEDAQERVFDALFTTKDLGQGKGQGLALANDIIVHQHGGNIGFTPNESGGTTFWFTLPCVAQQTTSADFVEQPLPSCLLTNSQPPQAPEKTA